MKELLKEGFAELGIVADSDAINRLLEYAKLLKIWNEKMNLTAVTDDFGIATKHFLDSASALLTGHIAGKVIDVGTGAGFPGLVLKILKPEIELTLLDSLQKRLTFLDCVTNELDIPAELIHARAEDGARTLREQFDTVVSRAVANMAVLSELTLPYLKVGGFSLSLKGPLAEQEINDAKNAIRILGGEIAPTFCVKIPKTDLDHKIVIIKKVRQTPSKYPRKAGVATKNPLH